MKRIILLTSLALFIAIGANYCDLAFAGGLTIHNGATLTMNNATLDLNCSTLTLLDGGTLYLNTGTIVECGSLFVYKGSVLNWDIGSIYYCVSDSDGDGIPDEIETTSCTSPYDADSDNDGIPDGLEDANQNGVVDSEETDPCNADTDGDGIQDGTESGYTHDDVGPDTNLLVFIPDPDPNTTTDPLNDDTDGDGMSDGWEEQYGLNPLVNDASLDPDKDGYTNLQEFKEGGEIRIARIARSHGRSSIQRL